MAPMSEKRHFSMIRSFHLADVITLANAFAGTTAILAAMKHLVTPGGRYLWLALGALPFALTFDFLDGRVARWRRKQSALGQELDSLADIVSFGVAPAAIAFAMGMRGFWDAVVLVYFVSCGIGRLARYNTTAAAMADESGKVRYFEGTPIPTSVLLCVVLAICLGQGRTGEALPLGAVALGPGALHPLVLMYAISGSAMISKTLHVPKP
jgi:CDP-diacylglycerol---serine O-phosphatidyltransferase